MNGLSEYTRVAKYARYNKALSRRDTWEEQVIRMRDMHLQKYAGCDIEEEVRWAFKQVLQQKVLGSQRALQYSGEPIEKKNARIYNCTVSYCDRVKFFQEAMWLLLCGCGVGFSVQKHHVAKLPNLLSIMPAYSTVEYYIEDSIEGWANALGVLVSSYLDIDSPFCQRKVLFDYSGIREKGSDLTSGAGKAPGPEPLKIALEHIRSLFEHALSNGKSRLRPIDCYDIIMFASDAVLSGGVRRSATICVFSPDDKEMLTAKTGNWFYKHPQRGRSNNSALLLRDKTTREKFQSFFESVKQFGEPGFVWADSTEILFNPCVEIGMYPVLEELPETLLANISYAEQIKKTSGWSFCNLCEINGKESKTEEDFYHQCKAAAIIGTLQAGYTKFDYLGPITEKIVRREALLGVSITGMMENPDVLFDPVVQRRGADIVRTVNAIMASKIGIRQSARTTCVKPAGTTSCLLETSSGIHAHHAKRYIRRVQGNNLEVPLNYYRMVNPLAVEKSVWGKDDSIVMFCMEAKGNAKARKDITALQLLELVKLTQDNWVTGGTNEYLCVYPWLKHNVSNTINVKPDEWDEVADFIYKYRGSFTGISLLGFQGDLDYPQAPFCEVHTPSEIVKMYGDGSLMASGLIVDGLHAFGGNLWLACDAALGNIECTDVLQMDWMRRAHQFASRYFNPEKLNLTGLVEIFTRYFAAVNALKKAKEDKKENDVKVLQQAVGECYKERAVNSAALEVVKHMTYCLKEVNNWKLWCDLRREHKHVDYTQMLESTDTTIVEDTLACAGGQCTLM